MAIIIIIITIIITIIIIIIIITVIAAEIQIELISRSHCICGGLTHHIYRRFFRPLQPASGQEGDDDPGRIETAQAT